MQAYTEKIQEAARRLLADKQVDVVIGFRKGTLPFMNEPFLAKNVDQVRQLYWDGNCGINLANYLPKRTDRIAIVAKGCDSRNIVVHLLEYQIKREQLYILGAPCKGMIDRRRILASLDGKEPVGAEEKDGKILVAGPDFRGGPGSSGISPGKLRHLHPPESGHLRRTAGRPGARAAGCGSL